MTRRAPATVTMTSPPAGVRADDAARPWQRLRDVLFRVAVQTTSAHLARARDTIVTAWQASLRRRVPRYHDVVETAAWGADGLRVVLEVARAWTAEEKALARDAVFRTARAVAGEQLRRGFSLEEIQQALALFRLAVLAEIQRMLRRRLWLAFPWDVMRVADRINEAIDLEMLAIGQAYLDERAGVIHRREQELVAGNEQLRTLLQEMHHRIKNNLQTLADLLYLEGREAGSPEVASRLRDSLARVKSIATVHRLLSLDHIGEADGRRLAEAIAETVCRDLGAPGTYLDVRVDGPSVLLPSKQATSLALVLGELLTNAIEHAFVGRTRGAVLITLHERGGEVTVVVRDDGVGLPAELDPQQVESLGLSIVRTLVSRDLRGRLRMWVDGGTIAEVAFRR
ncbi:MAG TPA: sensor histidine kinase [bacterium]|nr:sensor histidine kinase [bacterium]